MYSALQTAVKDYLVDQLTYTLPQRAPSIFSDSPPDTPEDGKAALESIGLILVVGKPQQRPINTRTVEVSVPLNIFENREINFSSTGANVEPGDLVSSATFALGGWKPDTFWARISAIPFDQLPPEQGFVGWGVMVKTKTILARSFAALVDHNGKFIIDHNSKALLTTNRGN